MSILITDSFRQQIARNTLTVFSDVAESIYLFYGKSLEWDSYDTTPSPEQSTYNENIIKSNILALKKISARDLILGIPRVDWESGTVYDYYTDQESMIGKNYYVITSENRVYKCLDNNGGNPSTEEPMHTCHMKNVPEEDGYVWQYMFQLSQPLLRKFSSSEYIPVDVNDENTKNIIASAVPGTINKIIIDDGGSGYSLVGLDNDPYSEFARIPLYVLGNGNEIATAKIRITGVTADGAINITITDPPGLEKPGQFQLIDSGSNYIVPTQFDGATETDGSAWIPVLIRQTSSQTASVNTFDTFEYAYGIAKVNTSGSIDALRITNSGKGYTLGEAVLVQSGCVAYALRDGNGTLTNISIAQSGQDFTVAKIIPVSDKDMDSNNQATFTPILSPAYGHAAEPEIELNARALMISVRIAYEELTGDFPSSNDFRTVGIIHNPRSQHSDGSDRIIANQLTLTGVTELSTSNESLDPNDWSADSIIVGTVSGAKAKIVEVIDNSVLRVIRDAETSNNTPFLVNEPIINESLDSALISSIKLPEYVPYSGDVLLINNIQAIERSNDQIETINFTLNL